MPPTKPIDQRLKLQHLKVVMAVAQCGSMGKAAKQLAISQPVVSKVIANLESMLGAQLFDRNSHGVEPTHYGIALLKRSIAVFDDLKTSVDEIKFQADPTAGALRIGSTEPLFAGLVVAAMERVWRQYPRIGFQVVQATNLTLINRDLPERRIEIAVVPLHTPSLFEGLNATILFQDRMRVVAGMKSRWARRRRITWAELSDEPWCVPPIESPQGASIGPLLANAFRAVGLKVPHIAVSSVFSPYLIARMLEDGRLLGLMNDSNLHFFFAKRLPIKKLPIELPLPPFPVAIIKLKNRTISPVAQLFIDCAREVVRPLAKRSSTLAMGWTAPEDITSSEN
jgi:DNA-binding transcriptional LysR family regulator